MIDVKWETEGRWFW